MLRILFAGIFLILIAVIPQALFAEEQSVKSSVIVHSHTGGGESHAEVHVKNMVNGEVREFHQVLNGEEAKHLEKTFLFESSKGNPFESDFSAGTDGTDGTDGKDGISVDSEGTIDVRVETPNPNADEKTQSGEKTKLEDFTQVETTAIASKIAPEQNIIHFVQKIFAYVFSFFSL